jgi:hypothetical protein
VIEQFFVHTGISGCGGSDVTYGTYVRQPSGSLRRVCSPKLPLRESRVVALLDLISWLESKIKDCRRGDEAAADDYHRQLTRLTAELAAATAACDPLARVRAQLAAEIAAEKERAQ